MNKMTVLGIDPGLNGALVAFNENGVVEMNQMPITIIGKEREVSHGLLALALERIKPDHIYLERAVSFGMGTKSAFNYGRAFAAIEMAIQFRKIPFTLVEPKKWTKVMHAGVSNDLKPKLKSEIAVRRLFPKIIRAIPCTPKSKKLHDGIVDAILIAAYGYRELNGVGLDTRDGQRKKKLFTDRF